MTSISALAKRVARKQLLAFASLALAAGFIAGCSDSSSDSNPQPTSTNLYGDTVSIGNGSGYSWIINNSDGTPSSLGLTLSAKALENLPDTGRGTSYVLHLPSDSMLAYNHISFDWNPHGHPPDSVYTVPHFDVHFYTISMEERMQIMPGPDTVAIDTSNLPARFMTDGEVIPMMGRHYISMDAHEFHDHNFDHTIIYGFYKGKFIFHEPMIALSYLQQLQDTKTFPIPQPSKYQMTGKYFPTKYSISYNPVTKEYNINLLNFMKY